MDETAAQIGRDTIHPIRNSVIGLPDLVAPTANVSFLSCRAARLLDWSGRQVCCVSEIRESNPAALGSLRTFGARYTNVRNAGRSRLSPQSNKCLVSVIYPKESLSTKDVHSTVRPRKCARRLIREVVHWSSGTPACRRPSMNIWCRACVAGGILSTTRLMVRPG